jgi:hypothetical protein
LANKIQHKRSSTGGATPTLSAGEIGINLTDKRVFTANDTVVFDAFQNTTSSIAISNASGGVLFVGNATYNTVINATHISIANSTNSVSFTSPTTEQKGGSFYLKADGTWASVTASATPGGSDTYVQFNDATSMGGSAGFTFAKTTNNVVIANTLTVGSTTIVNSVYVGVTVGGNSVIANGSGLTIANSTGNTITVQAPTTAEKAETRFLKVDGTWATVTASATAGGSNTNVQYNDSTAIGGSNGFTFDSSTNNVYIANTLTVDGALVINTDSFAVGNAESNTTILANNIYVNNHALVGYETIFVPASAMVSRTTAGPASSTFETATNKQMFKTLDFDATTQEYAQFVIRMPNSWHATGASVNCAVSWGHVNTTTNFGCVWGFQAYAYANGDNMDQTWATTANVIHTGGVNNAIYISNSVAVTISGSPTDEEFVMFQVSRVAGNTSDTCTVDARLFGVTIYYNSAGADFF